MSDLSNVLKKINLSTVVSGTNKTLKTIKKAIPVYKEIRPYIRKEKKLFNKEELVQENENKIDIKEKEYNDNLTFFQ